MYSNHCVMWNQCDLIQRVRQSLDIAERAVNLALHQESKQESGDRSSSALSASNFPRDVRPLIVSKVVAESAMLIRCASFLRDTDHKIAASINTLIHRLIPAARGSSLLALLCHNPSQAFDNAAAHIYLTDLGYRDEAVDQMLVEIIQGQDVGQPERLPNHQLEHIWLRKIWSSDDSDLSADLLANTCIARPLDALGASTHDLYAFTHVLLYMSDMGQRSQQWPRSLKEIEGDAEAALAAAVDADNFDLAAELLWTWPMLRLPWSPAATFSFGLLTAIQDELGFLPGPGYEALDCTGLPRDLQEEYILRTSYHATVVMGFLCASSLRETLALPATDKPLPELIGAIDKILALLQNPDRQPRWQNAIAYLDSHHRESLTEFVLSIALRRARTFHDLELLQECLDIALQCNLVEGTSVQQGFALLRRSTLLGHKLAFDTTDSSSSIC